MLKDLLDFIEDKKILILGFGIEGKASYKFIRKNFPNKKIYIADENDIKQSTDSIMQKVLKDEKESLIVVKTGEKYLDKLEEYDLILKTPGLSFKDINISKFEDKIYTSIDLFLKYYKNMTIGITGTKGKSTVSTLIYEILKKSGKDVYLLGNIGLPILDQIEKINEDSIIVIELSSHQLQFMKYTTQIAILVNIFPEHLDHYKSYEEYISCKFKIFENAENMRKINSDFNQIQIYGKNTEAMQNYNFKYNDEAICVDIEDEIYSDFIEKIDCKLIGLHNLQNAIFALIVADILNINIFNAIKTVKDFKGLPHRLEYVTKVKKVSYYDDSISTIPETTILALKGLKNTNTLILGGLDRGLDYTILISFLNKIYEEEEYSLKNIILLPDTGHNIKKHIRNEYNKIEVKDVKEAVEKAVEITQEGICLLSPAAASYGFYKNFEDRGNIFKKTIEDIKINNKKQKYNK